MIGQTISHYRILEKLGEGGMGVVYKAEDTKLKRTVALKFLPKGLEANEPERARFLQEAQAASALNHPNICNIHSLGEHKGQQFIDMEYLDGVTLRSKMRDAGCKMQDVISYAIQIGEALQEAHSHGIVHRDVKPENIMVNKKNQIKVMDFGLAKLKGSLKLTKTSSTVGTIAYMAPEQIQGGEVDVRSDIFSFGIVLFEMLTGRLPFHGEHEAAMIYSICNEEPEPISSFRTDVPYSINSIILKALQKEPSSRYQTTSKIIQELKESLLRSATISKDEMSIAVLPFENMSSDPDQEYFSDGLTEEVISDLSKVNSLRVISRSSIMTFKGTKKKIPEISRELNVQYILEGSVRKSGTNLRITAQLIDATSDAHLWAEKYSGTLEDVFDIQEKVSRSIVDALKITLTPKENKIITERPIPDVHAHEYYLRATYEIWKYSSEGLNNALRYLENAHEIVGENALLNAAISYVYFSFVNAGIKVEDLYIDKARHYAEKALNLDPESSIAHMVVGLLDAWQKSTKIGIGHLKRSLASDPNNYETLLWLCAFTAHMGRYDACERYLSRANRIDPFNPMNFVGSVLLHIFQGQYDRAMETLDKHRQAMGQSVVIHYFYGMVFSYTNRLEEAFMAFDQMLKIEPDSIFCICGQMLKHSLKGSKSEALQLYTPRLETWAKRDFGYSNTLAEIFSVLDQKEEALNWLENAVNRGMINYHFFNEIDPLFKNIKGEERFKKLMVRVKKEWEEFEV